MANYNEKRKWQRVDIRIPLQYKELRSSKSPKGTLTKNISAGGVKFYSNNFISLACRMVVEVTLPSVSRPIRAISKVAWIKKLPTGDDYEVGNQFLDMSRDDKRVISDYVKESISQTV